MIGETFTLNFTCAVEDKPFSVLLERDAIGLIYRIKSIDKIQPTSHSHKAAPVSEIKNVNANSVLLAGFQCPHCDASGGFFRCGECHHNICKGRAGKFLTRCRSSCGCVGINLLQRGIIASYSGHAQKAAKAVKQLAAPARKSLPSSKSGTSLIVRE